MQCCSATCFENAAALVSLAAAAAGSAPLAAAAAVTAAYLGLYPLLLLVSQRWLSISILSADTDLCIVSRPDMQPLIAPKEAMTRQELEEGVRRGSAHGGCASHAGAACAAAVAGTRGPERPGTAGRRFRTFRAERGDWQVAAIPSGSQQHCRSQHRT